MSQFGSREFDFIIFGASGFTGKYCVLQAPNLFTGYKWAVAGRHRSKLKSMLLEIETELGEDLSTVPVVIADVTDDQSLHKMAQRCRVLINCCGPYLIYGEPVVLACIHSRTDYVDACAEAQFMEKIQLKYHAEARERDVYVVNACGYDSVICEMGLHFSEQQFSGTLHSAKVYVRIWDEGPLIGATVNYGTWHSMVKVFSENSSLVEIRRELFKDQHFEFPAPKMSTKIIHKSPVTNKWYVPFANIDQGVSERTQRHFYTTEKKRPIQLREYYCLGRTIIPCLVAVFYATILFLITRFKWGVQLLLDHPEIFSLGNASKSGANRAKYTTAQFEHTFHCEGWYGDEHEDEKGQLPTHDMIMVVQGTNPAYRVTCICLLLSALTLIRERDHIPDR